MERAEFYERVKDSVGNYLPMGFKQMPVLICETGQPGRETALMTLKSGKRMPVMSLEKYLKSVEQGERTEQAVIRIGVDYSRHLSKERGEDRTCQR